MEYYAGLDVSMKETHICVVDRDGDVALETNTSTLPEAIAAALAKAPDCQRVVLETGRMAPTLYHGLAALGVPVICIESRQAHLALKSLATHKTDRNDARGLAQLARTGFFKPVHVKSLPAHAVRALILARKKLVGQRVTLENQIRGLAVVFGVRLPRGLSPAFAKQVASGSQGVAGLACAMTGLLAARNAVLEAITAIDRDMKRLARASEACRRLMTIPGVGQLTALAFVAAIDEPERFRRSRTSAPIWAWCPGATSPARSTIPAASRSAATDGSVRCSTRRPTSCSPAIGASSPSRSGRSTLAALDHAQGADRARAPARHHHARHAPARHRVQTRLGSARQQTGDRDELPSGALPEGGRG
jgi:transposase